MLRRRGVHGLVLVFSTATGERLNLRECIDGADAYYLAERFADREPRLYRSDGDKWHAMLLVRPDRDADDARVA